MNYKEPKISIIVPVYNVEKFLDQCLKSLVNQTYKNLEIICVNDGTKDNSQEIIDYYVKIDPRVKSLIKENGGMSSARNYGHRFVTGDYIMYVDSDDWVELNTCELAMNEVKKTNADIVFWNYIREFGDISNPRYILGHNRVVFDTIDDTKKLQRRLVGLFEEELRYPETENSFGTVWGKIYRANMILDNRIEYVDVKIIGTGEDILFNLYVFGYATKIVYIPNCLNHYRKDNNTSCTKTYKADLKTRWSHLYEYMLKYISDNNCDDSYIIALNNRKCLSIIGLGMNIIRSNDEIHKLKEIKSIIASEEYRKVSADLPLKYFPAHWKIFFFFTKHNWALGVYFLLWCMRKLKGN